MYQHSVLVCCLVVCCVVVYQYLNTCLKFQPLVFFVSCISITLKASSRESHTAAVSSSNPSRDFKRSLNTRVVLGYICFSL